MAITVVQPTVEEQKESIWIPSLRTFIAAPQDAAPPTPPAGPGTRSHGHA